MGKLYLYGIFHANLQFSAIPEEHYPVILDRCYRPVLELCRDLPVRLGLEFPAYTLETIGAIDAAFIADLKELAANGRCELIGSGYSQNIYPLIPAEINRHNLALGNLKYKELLGTTPAVAYVNEQVYAAGLTDLYLEAGYQSIFIDWDNTVMANPLPAACRYRPQMIEGGGGKNLQVIWNSFISFQRLQRYIHGDLTRPEYLEYLAAHYHAEEIRAFPFYGSDWEIFDYRPGNPDCLYRPAKHEEMGRLRRLLEDILADDRFALAAPSEIAEILPPAQKIRVVSPEYPLPCKKQAKYNVTRWAVCGRDNTKKNTKCHRLFRELENLQGLMQVFGAKETLRRELAAGRQDLCCLWGSDFRTFTTEEKNDKFGNLIGYNIEKMNGLREKAMAGWRGELTAGGGDFTLVNPAPEPWQGVPWAFELIFAAGRIYYPFVIRLDDKRVLQQAERVEYYPDGSVRRAAVVLYPEIPAFGRVKGRVCSATEGDRAAGITCKNDGIETPAVKAHFLANKGLAVKSLVFPEINALPLAGTLSHEFYDEAELSTDQFTGHVIINERQLNKITDLNKTEIIFPDNIAACNVRVPVRAKIPLAAGDLWKTVFVYVNEPRVDITYHFRLKDVYPQSFRLGMLTLNPQAFDRQELGYATVNGGNNHEHFLLGDQSLAQDLSSDHRYSTSHCLGATEGWISLGDRRSGVAVITDKSQLYSVPLLNYKRTKKLFYLRVYHTIGETDETSSQFWRGQVKFTVSYYGHGNDIPKIRKISRLINRGLVLINN